MNAIRPWLYIGRYRETLDLVLLQGRGIGAMLQLAEEVVQPGIAWRYLDVTDGEPLPEGLLRIGVDYVLAQRGEGRVVLVACGAGISRSATFVTAALKEAEGLRLWEAWQVVKAHHPPAMIHPALWDSLCAFYGEKPEHPGDRPF